MVGIGHRNKCQIHFLEFVRELKGRWNNLIDGGFQMLLLSCGVYAVNMPKRGFFYAQGKGLSGIRNSSPNCRENPIGRCQCAAIFAFSLTNGGCEPRSLVA